MLLNPNSFFGKVGERGTTEAEENPGEDTAYWLVLWLAY